ncbi:MAG: hypothetical protein BM563_09060 [Bacteroidetes bacterium MedPE-SWsnd-G1]|nr:MAG: hypothetical protein BM563_09060 [Bacteroidetes bacterium MedPE-SWsnd-G1]
MKRINFSLTIFLLFIYTGISQNYNSNQNTATSKKLSYQEFLDEMVNSKDSIYQLNNAIVQYNPEKDKRFLIFRDSLEYSKLDTLVINAKIELKNVDFKDFEKGNNSSDFEYLIFSKLEFKKEVSLTEVTVRNFIGFFNSVFHERFELTIHDESKDNQIYFFNSFFFSYTNFHTIDGRILIVDSEFYPTNNNFPKYGRAAHLFSSMNDRSLIQFGNSNFCRANNLDHIKISGELYSFRLYNNIFETELIMSELSIEDLTMHNNEFQGLIDFTNLDFGSVKSEVFYEQLKNKVGVYSNEDFFGSIWRPQKYESFQDEIASERLFSTFRRMTEYYKDRGNIKSYNSMFIEMKDLETLQLQFYYEEDKNISNWFSWKMNYFLGVFSNYGTSPIKAIIYAIKVILIFSIFFFFFHNDWDTFTKEKLMTRIRLLTKYFRSKEGIADLYQEQEKHKYKSYEDFKTSMNSGQHEIPKMFLWISRPLYSISTFRIKSTNNFLKKAEILDGKWLELKNPRKTITAISIGALLFIYLVSSLIMKVLNALMLSVNSFTTLGFGEIPTRGIGRYAAIIEGFIGWFLLTLFSVSLITQLLQ